MGILAGGCGVLAGSPLWLGFGSFPHLTAIRFFVGVSGMNSAMCVMFPFVSFYSCALEAIFALCTFCKAHHFSVMVSWVCVYRASFLWHIHLLLSLSHSHKPSQLVPKPGHLSCSG